MFVCALAKSHRVLYVSKHVTTFELFDLLYMDIWRLAPHIGLHGECYFSSLLITVHVSHGFISKKVQDSIHK